MSYVTLKDKLARVLEMAANCIKRSDIDSSLSDTSENPVQNKVIKSYVDSNINNCVAKNKIITDFDEEEPTDTEVASARLTYDLVNFIAAELENKLSKSNGAVKEANINANAVTTNKIANGSVTAVKLSNNSVTTDKIGNSVITGEKLADGCVSTDKILSHSVSWSKLDTEVTNKIDSLGNKTTTVDSSSTDDQIPSAKAVYDAIQSALTVDSKAVIE